MSNDFVSAKEILEILAPLPCTRITVPGAMLSEWGLNTDGRVRSMGVNIPRGSPITEETIKEAAIKATEMFANIRARMEAGEPSRPPVTEVVKRTLL